MVFAFIFPGQGSQYVGMGKALAESFPSAREVFDRIDAALGQNLSDLMWNGPEEELRLTTNTQPALMACSLAAMAALDAEFGVKVTDAKFVAGHSLGEYSALAAVESFSIEDTAKLLRIRGDAMQSAVPVGAGAMAALLGAALTMRKLLAKLDLRLGSFKLPMIMQQVRLFYPGNWRLSKRLHRPHGTPESKRL